MLHLRTTIGLLAILVISTVQGQHVYARHSQTTDVPSCTDADGHAKLWEGYSLMYSTVQKSTLSLE